MSLLPRFPLLATNLSLEASLCLCCLSCDATFGKSVPVATVEAVCGQGGPV